MKINLSSWFLFFLLFFYSLNEIFSKNEKRRKKPIGKNNDFGGVRGVDG